MSALLDRLPTDEDANVVVVAMLTPSHAVDLFLGDLESRSKSETGRTVASYRRTLDHFTDSLRPDLDVADITPDDCRRFFARFSGKSPGYRHTLYAILNSYFRWLDLQGRIKKNPLAQVPRPRKIAADALDVTTVSTADVLRLIEAAHGWTERLAVAIPAFTGARRRAVANLKLEDYDAKAGTLRFREKGGKTVTKPIPAELQQMLDHAIREEAITDYLVPSEGARIRNGDRDDRVIWRAVKEVGERAGVDVHVHALRAAFAVQYLETHKGDVEALKEHMGHESIATTQTYLRRLDKQAAMERVRDFSYGVAPAANGAAV